MEEELKVINELGVATSSEIGEFVDKNIRNVIRGLKQLELYGEVKIMIFKSYKHRKKVYLTNEIFNAICEIN